MFNGQTLNLNNLPPEFSNLKYLTIPKIFPPIINLIIVISVVLFLFSFLLGGIKMIISGGNKEKMQEAQRHLINAIIGIIIVFTTWAIISLIEQMFGVSLTTLELPRI